MEEEGEGMVHALGAEDGVGAVPAISSLVMASWEVSRAIVDGFNPID